jgi:hypothetical protein
MDVAIDLGEIGHAPVAVAPPAGPAVRRRRTRIAGVVLAVCAVIAGASGAAPPPAGPTLVFSAPFGQAIGLDDEVLYLASADNELTAYDLASGAVRWRTRVTQPISFLSTASGPVALSWDERCREIDSATAFDRATGRVLWTRRGSYAWAARPELALWRPDGHCTPSGTVDPRTGVLDVIEHATGEVRRSIPATEGNWSLGPTGDTVLTWDAEGDLTEWDIHTDARHERGRLAALARRANLDDWWAMITVVGDDWVVLSPLVVDPSAGEQGAAVNAYARADATPRWEQRLDDVIWRQGVYLTECEPAICVVGQYQSITLDPATGVRIGSLSGRSRPLRGTGWAVSSIVEGTNGVTASPIVDAQTGRPDPSGWAVLPSMTGTSGQLVLVRRLVNGLDFATLDRVTGRLRPIGSLDGEIYSTCDVSGHYLSCIDGSQVSVWHVP